MKAVSFEGVSRSFSGRTVLREVSASAEAGQVVGLLGRNGEGKTTLLRILLDILAADSGTVAVLGQRPD
ncbi:MAG: ATP-binding cassette domain-containing protein, partial [Elusimicrobia bacterium]|nr:ATP-binding cassette domain-containing protein [Elusimicrobiota bacterium]